MLRFFSHIAPPANSTLVGTQLRKAGLAGDAVQVDVHVGAQSPFLDGLYWGLRFAIPPPFGLDARQQALAIGLGQAMAADYGRRRSPRGG
jgi:hypothetical protein